MTLNIPTFHLNSIGPALILTVTAIVILLLDALSPKGRRKAFFPQLSLLGLAAAALQTYLMWGSKGTDFARMIYVDNYTFFFYFIFILGTALTVMISTQVPGGLRQEPGRILRPAALRHRGHDAHGRQRPSHHAVPGPGSHVHRGLRPGGAVPGGCRAPTKPP